MKGAVATVKTAVVPLFSQVQQHELPRIQTELQLLCPSFFALLFTQQEAETWWRERKKPKGLSCREYKGQGLSETGRMRQTTGRWGSFRGRNAGLKEYWELRGTAVCGGHQKPRPLRGKGWGGGGGGAAQDWDMEGKEKGTVQLTGCGQCCVCTKAGDMGTGRSCNCYSWQRGEGPQEKWREGL